MLSWTSTADPLHTERLDVMRRFSDATPIEHAVVQAVLRASLELHGALSMIGSGSVADRLCEALERLDEAINEVRRTVAQRAVDATQ